MVFNSSDFQVKEIAFNEAYANYHGNVWQQPQYWGNNAMELTIENLQEQEERLRFEVSTEGFENNGESTVKEVSVQPGNTQKVDLKIPIRDEGLRKFTTTITNAKTKKQYHKSTYSTRVPPCIEFDLSQVYSKDNSNGNIFFIPMITEDLLDKLSLKLELLKRDSAQVLAVDSFSAGFLKRERTICFKDLNLSSLSTGNYKIQCSLLDKNENRVGFFTQLFTRQAYEKDRKFGVREGEYSYGGETGDAVIIEFDDEKDFVFWEHAQYIPWWDVHNMAVTYEFVESWGYGTIGSSEPMQDKENRYQRVRIVENSPARVVVHWRYPLSDPLYQIFLNEWVDEYYTFYPNGLGTRKIQLWANSSEDHEITQPQYIYPSGVLPYQMFEDIKCKLLNTDKGLVENPLHDPLFEKPEEAKNWNEEIFRMQLKERPDPFLVISEREDITPGIFFNGLIQGDLRYALGGHWPMQKMNIDVYSIVSPHRPYHGWLDGFHVVTDKEKVPNQWLHLVGMTDQDDEYLRDVAASWLYPAEVTGVKGKIEFEKFDVSQFAYVFNTNANSGNSGTFTLRASKRAKVINPVFIIKNETSLPSEVFLDKKTIDHRKMKCAFINDGKDCLIWLDEELPKSTKVEIKF